jgi:hypothetical protein
MSCFTVQVLEPSGKIIEVETCAGDTISNIVLQNYTSPEISISQCITQLPSDFNDRVFAVVSGDIVASTGMTITSSGGKIYLNSILNSDYGIDLSYSSGIYTIFATGLQPSGDYTLVGHQHNISEINNYDTAVSGLLPITDIIGGTNISVNQSGTTYTVSVSGQLGLTAEQVDDRVYNLLSAGTGIYLNYDDLNDTLTINTSGLQPSGDYSLVGHTHNSSQILDFNSSVSGLLIPYALLYSPNFSGIPTVPTAPSGTNSTQIASTSFVINEIYNLIDSAPSTLDTLNELAAALGDDANFAVSITNLIGDKVAKSGDTMTGSLYAPSGIFSHNLTVAGMPVSISGHSHLSNDITNFNSSVSGLLPSISGSGYVNTSLSNNIYTISVSGLQPSGNYATASHTHISSDITDFNTSVSGLLPVKDIIAGMDINISNSSGIYTINASNSTNIDTLEPDGFINRTDSTISFNNISRQFTIAPTGSSYSIYNNGIKIIKSSPENITLPTGTALYFIHFDKNTNNLSYKTTGFDFISDIPIAHIYWNNNDNKAVYFGEERHGITMDSATHKYLHNVFGTQYINGLSISNYTTTGNGSINSDATISIGDGVIYDEDIEVNITNDSTPTNPFEQILSPIAQIPVYYKNGSNGYWTNTTANNFPLKVGTTAQYNLYSGGSWSASDTDNPSNDRFVATWICATSQEDAPIITIMGQRVDSSLEQAKNHNSWSNLNLTGLPIVELRPLYRLIYDTKNSLINNAKAFLVDILDIRSHLDTVTGITQNDHGSLYGLADDDHLQYVHIDNARTIDAIHTFTNGLISNGPITISGINVSLSGHQHTVSDIINFNSGVSGLLPSVSGSGYATTSFANNIYTISITGLQPSGNYSQQGHTHNSSEILNFANSVSGLLPVLSILGGSGIYILNNSGIFNISTTGIPYIDNQGNLLTYINIDGGTP